MKIIKPSVEYKKSYYELHEKFKQEGWASMWALPKEGQTFEQFIKDHELIETERCIEVEPFYVPATVFWIVDEEKKIIIAKTSIRHRLNEVLFNVGGHIGYIVNPDYRRQGYAKLILEKSLEFAKSIGLGEVLITCNEDNIPSQKTILSKGGEYINNFFSEQDKKMKQRYRIVLDEKFKNSKYLFGNFPK